MLASKTIQTLVLFTFAISLSGIRAQRAEEDAFSVLGISWNPRALTRRVLPKVNPTPHPVDGATTLSKDIFIYTDESQNFRGWPGQVRLYIPIDPPTDGTKLPLIIYLHGGNFVLYSTATEPFHNFCNDIAAQFPAIVVSVEYSLAPEHFLPLPYSDTLDVLYWAKKQALRQGINACGRDPWMEYADFSRVYFVGTSSGANIAYNVALKSLMFPDSEFKPLEIKGLLLNQPYFGGAKRTESELRLINDKVLPLYLNDVQLSLAMLPYLDRDHHYCNPIKTPLVQFVHRLPKVYIKSDFGDPLVDRAAQLAQFLLSHGVPVYSRFNSGGYHGIEMHNRTVAQQLYDEMKWFISEADADLKSSGDISYYRLF